jgi:hypothetical protein
MLDRPDDLQLREIPPPVAWIADQVEGGCRTAGDLDG